MKKIGAILDRIRGNPTGTAQQYVVGPTVPRGEVWEIIHASYYNGSTESMDFSIGICRAGQHFKQDYTNTNATLTGNTGYAPFVVGEGEALELCVKPSTNGGEVWFFYGGWRHAIGVEA